MFFNLWKDRNKISHSSVMISQVDAAIMQKLLRFFWHRYIFFWKMLLRAEKIANFNFSKWQNQKQIAFTMQLNMNLMSNVHVLDISDTVCIAEMLSMQYIHVSAFLTHKYAYYQQILPSFVDEKKYPYEPKKFQTKKYTYAKKRQFRQIFRGGG